MLTIPAVPTKLYNVALDKVRDMTEAEQRTYMQMAELFNDNMTAYEVFDVMAKWLLLAPKGKRNHE